MPRAMSEETEKQPNPVDIHVGKRVRMRRTLMGMSQTKLGDALGLTFQQVQKYENGSISWAPQKMSRPAATALTSRCPGNRASRRLWLRILSSREAMVSSLSYQLSAVSGRGANLCRKDNDIACATGVPDAGRDRSGRGG